MYNFRVVENLRNPVINIEYIVYVRNVIEFNE